MPPLFSLARLAAVLLPLAAVAASPPPARITSVDDFQARDAARIDPETAPGRALFAQHCAICHMGAVPKAPSPQFLGMLSPAAIVKALNEGVMREMATGLAPAERIAVAEYLTRTPYNPAQRAPEPPACTGANAAIDWAAGAPAIGWGRDNRRFVPAAVAGLAKADVPRLKLLWAWAYPAAFRARSQPSIAWGTLFVGSQDGTIYAFDPRHGCTRWIRHTGAEVRTALVADPAARRLYFGDLLGRVHAIDAATGADLWQVRPSAHADATITAAPTLAGGLLYAAVSSLEVAQAGNPHYACCTFRGLVAALDPATGREVWRFYTAGEPKPQPATPDGTQRFGPSGAPVWNSPTYDARRGLLYFGSGENYSSPADGNSDAIFAVEARTGRLVWRTQLTKGDAWNVGCMLALESCPQENGPDYDLSASALLIDLGGGRDILVLGQKSGWAYGVAPDSGAILWRRQLGHGGTQGGVHFGMAAEGTRIFAPVNDMANTYDGRHYDPALRGAGLHALDAATGRPFWFAKAADRCAGKPFCDPGISAAATAMPGVVFAGHLDGMLRAYDAASGALLWQADTTAPVTGVDGRQGHGGSMSGPGPAIWQGLVIANSGYGMYSHMAGNVLLVYAAGGS